MDFREKLADALRAVASKMGYLSDKVTVTFSNRPELCDFQSNFAMLVAKEAGRKPIEVAEELVLRLNKSPSALWAEFSAAMPGFVNMKLKNVALEDFCEEVLTDKNSCIPQVKTPRLVFFDYGGANVAKELHVGHLRSPIVGEALKRLHIVMGDKTLSDVHLGDYGLQMGLTILQLKLDGFLDNFFADGATNFDKIDLKNVTLDVLNDEYPKASKRKDVDEEFKAQADKFTLYVQRKQEPYYMIYKKIRALSVKEIKKNYDLLNTTFDFYYGESDAQDFIEPTIKIFEDKHLARESAGALVVDVAQEGEHVPIPKKSPDEPQRYKNPMPPAIIKKYNGGDLYATTDIATILMRNKDFAPDEIVYVTDNRQVTHFKQVFRCCYLAGISPQSQKLTHVAFGTMNGRDGKPFKTRAGDVVRLKEVVGLLTDKAAEKLASNGIVGDSELARKIGVGAMKFGDLSNTVEKDYVFDIDKFLAFDGKTGPYIQYTIARINSILAKAGSADFAQKCSGATSDKKPDKVCLQNDDERAIVLAIIKLCSSYQICYDAYSMNALCLSAFDLSSAFSTFYNNHRILTEPDLKKRNSMLTLCRLVKICLEKALWTLGIDTVEKM